MGSVRCLKGHSHLESKLAMTWATFSGDILCQVFIAVCVHTLECLNLLLGQEVMENLSNTDTNKNIYF